MKSLLIFASGVAVGAVGAIIWLRKSIKQKLSEIEQQKNADKEGDLPFEMGQSGANEQENRAQKVFAQDENANFVTAKEPISIKNETRIEYNKIVEQVKNGEKVHSGPQVPVLPRDDLPENIDQNLAEIDENEEESVNPRAEVFFEIDRDTFDNDKDFEKKRLVYFTGDRVMCTEAGTVINNPYLFVGNQWEQFVGNYAKNTAFVRNTRLTEDYEVYVEQGNYVDEYGYDSL